MLFWKRTLHDLRIVSSIHIRQEMVRAMSATESLIYVVGQMFGTKEPEYEKRELNTVTDMQAFARMING